MKESKSQLSDEALMMLFQNGDVESFEILYGRNSSRVFTFLVKRVDAQSASELLQEVFLKLHKNRRQYSSQYPFLPWLFAITRNAVVDFVRRKENKTQMQSDQFIDNSDGQVLDSQNSMGGSGELILALETLPDQQKQAIQLRYSNDWTFEQIASELKTSPANVRQMISRGIRKLRSKIGNSNE